MRPLEKESSVSSIKIREKVSFDLIESLRNRLENKQDSLIMGILLHAGIYLFELIELTPSDLDPTKKIIRIRKEVAHDRKERMLELPQELISQICRYCDPKKPYLFESPLSGRLNQRYVHRLFARVSLRFGARITPKMLQHLYRAMQIRSKKGGSSFGLKRFDEKKAVSQVQLYAALKKADDTRLNLLIAILLETGCGVGELLLLKKSNIDFLENQIIIEGKNSRVLDVSSALSARLYSYCQEHVFSSEDFLLSRKKKPLSRARLSQMLSHLKPHLSAKEIRYACFSSLFSSDLSKEELVHRSGIRNITKFHLFGALQEHD